MTNIQEKNDIESPDFLIKSTLWISLTAFLLILPFAINNVIQARLFLGTLSSILLVLCTVNIWYGYQGRYNNKFNLFVIVPFSTIMVTFCISQLGVAGSYWSSLSLLSLYFILPQKQAWISNIIFITILTPVAWLSLAPDIAIRFFAVLIGSSIFAFAGTWEVYDKHYLLKKLSITDPLTGVYNRSLLQKSIENAINRSYRADTPMVILMLDIDYFKRINDQFGHDIGDSVLISTGEFLTQFFRTSDIVFRIGGEEFLVIVHNVEQESALKLAEKLRLEFSQLPLVPNHPVTISIGMSCLQADTNWKQWMKQADENLYRAKHSGRNQVISSD